MPADITGAEFRARLTYLGLTLNWFSGHVGRDARSIRRQVEGVSRSITENNLADLEKLEAEASITLTAFDKATEAGIPIEIPSFDSAGDRPGTWWHALAGRHIAAWGEDAQIEYSSGIVVE